jgi:phosphatidylglycerophosphate synthase
MRKIPEEYDNPVDNLCIHISDIVSPTFYKYGITPNWITTLSNVCAIIVILLLLQANYVWAALFFMIAYFFDCLDGFVARKYNLVSAYGDMYDHASDIIKGIATFYTLYYINKDKFFKVIPIIIVAFILSLIHIGCQEKLYDKDEESQTLKLTKTMCPADQNNQDDIKNKLSYTRYFGMGSLNLIIAICIIYYGY